MRKIFHRRKEDPPFRIRCPEDIKLGMSDYPEATTEEHCDFCLHMVKIPAYGVSKCPVCRNDIIPCSVCDANCKSCPYEQYGYNYGKTCERRVFFDPKSDVSDRILFYEIFTDNGEKFVQELYDFSDLGPEADGGYMLNDRSERRPIDPWEFAHDYGFQVFDPAKPVSSRYLTGRKAKEVYYRLLDGSKYLPIENITQLTPQGKYWARLDLPYYPEGY